MITVDVIGFLFFGLLAVSIGAVLYGSYRRASTEAHKYVLSPTMRPVMRVDKRWFVGVALLLAVFCFDAALSDYFHPVHLPDPHIASTGIARVLDIACRIVLLADIAGMLAWLVALPRMLRPLRSV